MAAQVPRESVIGYCPVINAPPTELSANHEALQNAADMGRLLPQVSADHFHVNLLWANSDFSRIIMSKFICELLFNSLLIESNRQ